MDGPNNVHMKVSLLPEKSDVKASEHRFDPNGNFDCKRFRQLDFR